MEDVFILRVERRGFPNGGDGVDFIKLADIPEQRGGVQLKEVVFLLVLINEPDFLLQSGDSRFTCRLDDSPGGVNFFGFGLLLLFTELSLIHSPQNCNCLLQLLVRLILSRRGNDEKKNGSEEYYRSHFGDWIHWLDSFQISLQMRVLDDKRYATGSVSDLSIDHVTT